MLDIITIGSATQDVFLMSKEFKLIRSKEFATGIGECVSFGSKIEIDELVVTTGGGATNAAATFASLGLTTGVITRIGDDLSGDAVLKDLQNYRINAELVHVVKNGKTGYSTLLTAENGERSVLVHRGVSESFQESDIPFHKINAKWLYITSLAGNLSLIAKLLRHAKEHQMHVAFNPGSKELKQGLRAFEPILRELSVLILNKEELQLLTGMKSGEIAAMCQKIAKKELMIFVTDGGKGSYAFANNEILFARTRSVPIISRTGAGDAFGSGVIASLMTNRSVTEALQVGTMNAESVIGSFGAKYGILSSFPTKEECASISVKSIPYEK